MWLLIAALFLDVGGVQRRYFISLPARPHAAPAVPMLHGGGGSAERAGDRGMDEQGTARGFIVRAAGRH